MENFAFDTKFSMQNKDKMVGRFCLKITNPAPWWWCLEGPIQVAEVWNELKVILNKAPGPNRLPDAFLQDAVQSSAEVVVSIPSS